MLTFSQFLEVAANDNVNRPGFIDKIANDNKKPKKKIDEAFVQYDRSKPDSDITHYHVIQRHTKQLVGKSKTVAGARKTALKHDLHYGAAVHSIYPVYKSAISEVSPPGWRGTTEAMKKHKDITNPWALAWWMKNKGYKSHKPETKDV